MKTLVTGANGFVGAALCRVLAAEGFEVRALVRPGSDRRNLSSTGVKFAEGDIRDPDSLFRATAGCRFVFHVAADYRLWVRRARNMYETNVRGSLNVLEAADRMGAQRMVYTSSVATLGQTPDGTPANEATPSRLNDMIGHYKRSKYLAEEAVRSQARKRGFPVVTVNPSTPVGPGDFRPTPTGRLILDAAAGRMPAYVDTGLNVVHVDDVALGHLLALRHGRAGERYILGGTDLSLLEILERVAQRTGRRPPVLRLPRWSLWPVAAVSEAWAHLTGRAPRATIAGIRMARRHMYFSDARARSELGYRARPADDGIGDAIEWFRRFGYLD